MNILVTGAKGMLGCEINDLSKQANYKKIETKKDEYISIKYLFKDLELDITNYSCLNDFFESNEIDIVINCAAYTAVDDAEDEKEKAFLINEKGVDNLAILSNKFSFLLIQISTDFIFDGNRKVNNSYLETDKSNPLSVYGLSKLKGEIAIVAKAQNYLIIRTSWLYSIFGKNFFKTILRLSSERESLSMINDQIGTPTYAFDLAETILNIVLKISKDKYLNNHSRYINNIYNFSNHGEVSWYQFAKEIVRLSKNKCSVNPIATSEYITKAVRPKYSVLNKSKIIKAFNLSINDWDKSLEMCYKRFKSINN